MIDFGFDCKGLMICETPEEAEEAILMYIHKNPNVSLIERQAHEIAEHAVEQKQLPMAFVFSKYGDFGWCRLSWYDRNSEYEDYERFYWRDQNFDVSDVSFNIENLFG